MGSINRIAILSNVNLEILNQDLLKKYHVFKQDGYGQWIQYAIDDKKISSFNPDIIFLILDGFALLEGVTDNSDIELELHNIFAYIERLALSHASIPVYVSNIDIPPRRIIEGDSLRPEHITMNMWENKLREHILNNKNLHIFHLRTMIENVGRNNFYSDKMWYMGSIPYSMKGISCIKENIENIINNQSNIRKKVLLLDLDNTLWGGVIGEDGIEGIQLSRSLIGAAYRDSQLRIKELAESGILLAIVSKNNEEDVLNVLREHPQMVLKEDDFVAIYANWDNKANNIINLANKLNLGLDSFVFLDDNPVEREAVRLALPEVTVVEFPKDISNLPSTIEKIARDYFYAARLTKEDIMKTEQYQQEAKRRSALESAATIEDYLVSLQIEVVLGEMQESQIERVAQLTQKTNQFNILTRRYTTEQLIEYKSNENNHIYVANVSDKYGDSGLVFVLMISKSEDIAQIDNLLMSCRVMGRYIEDSIIDSVERKLMQDGVKEIRAKYIPTAKNKPVENLLERLGYKVTKNDNNIKSYRRRLTEDCPQRKVIFEAIWR
jgi:FkbH-like protein